MSLRPHQTGDVSGDARHTLRLYFSARCESNERGNGRLTEKEELVACALARTNAPARATAFII